MSIDKDSLIIVQAITEGIAVACKRLPQLAPAGAAEEDEAQPAEAPAAADQT